MALFGGSGDVGEFEYLLLPKSESHDCKTKTGNGPMEMTDF